MYQFVRFQQLFTAFGLLLVAILACRLPPLPTPEPTMDIMQALKATQTAAALLTPRNTATPTLTNTPTATRTFTASPSPTATIVFLFPTLTRAPSPVPTATRGVIPTLRPSGKVCGCSADILSCSDFVSDADAQACYDFCQLSGRGDVHDLDSDGDGVACEEVP